MGTLLIAILLSLVSDDSGASEPLRQNCLRRIHTKTGMFFRLFHFDSQKCIQLFDHHCTQSSGSGTYDGQSWFDSSWQVMVRRTILNIPRF